MTAHSLPLAYAEAAGMRQVLETSRALVTEQTPGTPNASDEQDERALDPAADAGGTPSEAGGEVSEDRRPDPLIGRVVADRYRVTELIGTGGMGAVYRAEHIHMKKPVALKVLHREMTALPEVVRRFEREAIAAGRIEHPNVVQARDFGRIEKDGAFYLVLEYVEGQVLGDVLDAGKFSVERTLSVTGQIAEALQAAHAQEIVHRDLKPDNIMLVEQRDGPELVKVLDFGIAKVEVSERGASQRPITKIGTVFGTPEYMSPEQAAGQPVDHRGDVYCLGLLMYRMLSGRTAFAGEEVNSILMRQITQQPEPLPDDIPAGVRRLVDDLLEKEPKNRIQTAEEVVNRVLALVGEKLPTTSRTRAKVASVALVQQRPTVAQRLDASPLGKRVRVMGLRVALWRLSVVGGLLLVLLVGLGLMLAAGEEQVLDAKSDQPTPEPTQAQALPTDPELDKLVAKAFVGDADAVAELEKRPADGRSVRQWLALGRGRAKLGRAEDALQAYQTALEQDPEVGKDPALRRDVWDATKDPKTADNALRLAAGYLGSVGADLLYKVWVDTKKVTPTTSLAKELVYSQAVREQASPALSFLLDWRAAETCDEYAQLLPRASLSGDFRAVVLLARLMKSEECDLPEDSLEAAMSAVKDRPEPAPF